MSKKDHKRLYLAIFNYKFFLPCYFIVGLIVFFINMNDFTKNPVYYLVLSVGITLLTYYFIVTLYLTDGFLLTIFRNKRFRIRLRFIYVLMLTLIILFLSGSINKEFIQFNELRELAKNGVITEGEVTKLYSIKRSSRYDSYYDYYAKYQFLCEHKVVYGEEKIERRDYDKLSVGDRVPIIYLEKNSTNNFPLISVHNTDELTDYAYHELYSVYFFIGLSILFVLIVVIDIFRKMKKRVKKFSRRKYDYSIFVYEAIHSQPTKKDLKRV